MWSIASPQSGDGSDEFDIVPIRRILYPSAAMRDEAAAADRQGACPRLYSGDLLDDQRLERRHRRGGGGIPYRAGDWFPPMLTRVLVLHNGYRPRDLALRFYGEVDA